MGVNLYQTDPIFRRITGSDNIRKFGCYEFCLYKLAQSPNLQKLVWKVEPKVVLAVHNIAISLGYLNQDCFVNNPGKIHDLMAGVLYSDNVQRLRYKGKVYDSDKIAKYMADPKYACIHKYKWQHPDVNHEWVHFVIDDPKDPKECLYDPWENKDGTGSLTREMGDLVSIRLFERV